MPDQQFEVYALENYDPLWIGHAESLTDAENVIRAHASRSHQFLVYSQRTGVSVFYERTPEKSFTWRTWGPLRASAAEAPWP